MQSTAIFRPQPAPVELRTYATLHQLREQLTAIERSPRLREARVVLVLDDHFSGHLPALIRRRPIGGTLTLVRPSGRVMVPVRMQQAAMDGDLLGWREIVFARELDEAIDNLNQPELPNLNRIVFWPEWRDYTGVLPDRVSLTGYSAGGSR